MDDNLKLEAEAFDSQIQERVRNGHIPDLRYTVACDYFYNNVWRRPAYVKLDFGEIFELIRSSINANVSSDTQAKVLEVGCGPGFISLELARAGYNVLGLDLSPQCIEVARNFADKDPHKHERGSLTYRAADLFAIEDREFDAVVFVGALHHFPDQDKVMTRITTLLKPGGIIIAHEPTRDRVTKRNAAFVDFVKVLLSVQNGYFETIPVPANRKAMEELTEKTFKKMRYELESGEKAQSVNDNEAGFTEMYGALKKHFSQIEFKNRYAFFHEMIGGLRFDEKKNVELAAYLKEVDAAFCDLGILNPAEFYFVGKKS
ncbi:MAG TPA: class I SAM-dependent methyltransferase [Chryseosolibacter sp.]